MSPASNTFVEWRAPITQYQAPLSQLFPPFMRLLFGLRAVTVWFYTSASSAKQSSGAYGADHLAITPGSALRERTMEEERRKGGKEGSLFLALNHSYVPWSYITNQILLSFYWVRSILSQVLHVLCSAFSISISLDHHVNLMTCMPQLNSLLHLSRHRKLILFKIIQLLCFGSSSLTSFFPY